MLGSFIFFNSKALCSQTLHCRCIYSTQEILRAFTPGICVVCTVKYASPNCLQPCQNYGEWRYLSQKTRQWVGVQKQSYQPNGYTSHAWPWLRAVQLLGSAWKSRWISALQKGSRVELLNHSEHFSHMPQGERKPTNPVEGHCNLHGGKLQNGSRFKGEWVRRDYIILGFWDLLYHFRSEDIRVPGFQVTPTRLHRRVLVGIRDQLGFWRGFFSGARHPANPQGDPCHQTSAQIQRAGPIALKSGHWPPQC